MKQVYTILAKDLLHQYHSKFENMRSASAVADAVRVISQNDYAFRLSIGMEGLLSVARAAGDDESADQLETIISKCNAGEIPCAGTL
ncbi:hypothetical protein GKQ23_15695 [Erwinia sp. E602]|nr:hypothetical protein GKQ23_15695 [Erwinia sp. E602]